MMFRPMNPRVDIFRFFHATSNAMVRSAIAITVGLTLSAGAALAQNAVTEGSAAVSDSSAGAASSQATQQSSAAAQYSTSLDRPLLDSPQPEGAAAGGGQNGGYHSSYNSNSGWASHLTFEGGVGFNQPFSGASQTATTAWAVKVGGGYNFTPRVGLLAEYSFNRFGLTNTVINEAGTDGGNSHLWSLTLEPIVRYKIHGKVGGYLIGGGGFYRALTSFTNAVEGIYCDPFYGCYPVSQSYVVSHFSSNQGGVNIGTGFTYKLDPADVWAFYSEVRYEWVNTPGHSSEFIPVTFGVRW
jgi:hypothetical protein